jgi:hypothetical protein
MQEVSMRNRASPDTIHDVFYIHDFVPDHAHRCRRDFVTRSLKNSCLATHAGRPWAVINVLSWYRA